MPDQGVILSIFNDFNFGIGMLLAVMAVLLICSALVSGSEVAYYSLAPAEINELKKSKANSAGRVLDHISKPKELLATILIANNFINVAIILVSTKILDKWLDMSALSPWVQGFIEIGIVTFIILLVGEVIPKVYANNNSVTLAKTMSTPIVILRKIFYPLSILLVNGTSFIDKRIKKTNRDISVDDLEHALAITDKSERSEDEQRILQGIVKFGDTDVKQIMKPRMDVFAIEDTDSFKDIKEKIIDAGFSRVPVFIESFDNIKGILYVKDLIPYLHQEEFHWLSLLRTPFFVPENKKIADLLREFQDSKVHIALVVDEFGGSSGIVTLEDIIEEIIGDISDEFDDEDLTYSKIDDTNYVFEGKTPLNDLYRILEIDGETFEENKGEADTIAGFLIELAGKILMKNEKVNFEHYTFTIEASDKRRIKQVKVTIKEDVSEN